jgi:hypothetical protein
VREVSFLVTGHGATPVFRTDGFRKLVSSTAYPLKLLVGHRSEFVTVKVLMLKYAILAGEVDFPIVSDWILESQTQRVLLTHLTFRAALCLSLRGVSL